MTAQMLNAWPEVSMPSGGVTISRICFESTSAPLEVSIGQPRLTMEGDYEIAIAMENTNLIMAEDSILVADGLIRGFRVFSDRQGSTRVTITLEHPVAPVKEEVPGAPYLTRFVFHREPLRQVFKGRPIGIDPGHGGRDRGLRGPVNLLEKDVSLAISREIQSLLENCGAVPVMTRTADITIGDWARLGTLEAGAAELCVQVHVSGDRDPNYQKYRLFTKKGCDKSAALGMTICEALLERMGTRIDNPEVLLDSQWDSASFPVVRVEPLCLTHYVDEANFRAPLFRKRTAQAIYNGIHRFISGSGRPTP